ncbi:MAG: Stp1/IreP family PP2C-type Ser/Thr phosphatase [Firmicutes bacterium]|nr:Stp1/IreP family PP2C-type Ser/Thr phosphatase [Bacillota bacterium]
MEFGARTDIGLVRKINEDGFHVGGNLFAVADGMGGHQAGEVASRVALEVLADYHIDRADPKSSLQGAFQRANEVVYMKARKDKTLVGMGTTLTALLITEGRLWVAHVGDSRAYLCRQRELVQLTQDHSVVGELVRNGDLSAQEARFHPHRNLLTRALGTASVVAVDVFSTEWQQDDKALLCTDGLSGPLEDDEIRQIIQDHDDPQGAVDELIRQARKRGAPDNVTAVLIKLASQDKSARRRHA